MLVNKYRGLQNCKLFCFIEVYATDLLNFFLFLFLCFCKLILCELVLDSHGILFCELKQVGVLGTHWHAHDWYSTQVTQAELVIFIKILQKRN